jgi:hypothetical protein
VVELPLATPVPAGGTIEVSFKFLEQLPEVFARTGYKGEFHMVGQWFPKIGVRVGPPGAEQWECQPLHAFTEFFADFGTYDVTLTVPNTHVVAATGVLVAASESPGATRQLRYHAEDVHDFAWMADPYMTVISGQAKVENDNVEVRVYARPEQAEFAKRHLDAAIGAIERFSADFVPYPWPIMSVVDPPVDATAGAGGMEYPTLVTTAGDTVFARPGIHIPEYVTIHEVGHNWFQGVLASNEAEEAWLDEGVNEWADMHVLNDLYGPRHGVDWMGWQADLGALIDAIMDDPASVPSPIATAAYAFVDSDAYGQATYMTTRRALATLEQTVGSSKMMAAMKAYARAFAFKHPTGRDLYATLASELGTDLSWFFAPVFQQVGGLHVSLRSASCRPLHAARGVYEDATGRKTKGELEAPDGASFVCEVVIQNTGVVHVPVDLELRFADGSVERCTHASSDPAAQGCRRWDDRGGGGAWQRFVVERSARLTEVRIDPDGKLALDSPIQHDVRIAGDMSASLRASARAAGWLQLVMQVVGP